MAAIASSALLVLASWSFALDDVATAGGAAAGGEGQRKEARFTAAQGSRGATQHAPDDVELRGRVVCLGPSRTVQPCGEVSSRFALQSAEGELRPFLTSDVLTGIFADEGVRQRELLVRARPARDGIEIIKVYSIHAGKLHDLDYFCEVCNIVAYVPGPCPCCRQALVLRERPLP